MEKLTTDITEIAEARFKEEDLQDCFLVDILINGKKIEVFIDADKGVKFWQCQKLSRAIEAYLDESKIIGEKYTLEVSSPGVDRPLKFKRQYAQHIGRKIEVILDDDAKVSGTLKEIKGEMIIVETPKSKKIEAQLHELRFDNIKESKILVTFSK
ncbi:MAG: ribosome maturation factor [Saprospiraceae bacterium]|nr:ribosome maturation factor [Saprospiraceae bacterium]